MTVVPKAVVSKLILLAPQPKEAYLAMQEVSLESWSYTHSYFSNEPIFEGLLKVKEWINKYVSAIL